MRRFNDWLALKITNSVGTMACVYAFAVLALVSLPAALASGNSIVIVGWVAQTFLQLVLLPLLMVGQKVQQEQLNSHADSHDLIHAKLNTLLNKGE